MRGRLASRAHSFKENILGAFGHHNASSEVQSPTSLIHAHEDHGNTDGRSHGSHSAESSNKGYYSKNKSNCKYYVRYIMPTPYVLRLEECTQLI